MTKYNPTYVKQMVIRLFPNSMIKLKQKLSEYESIS